MTTIKNYLAVVVLLGVALVAVTVGTSQAARRVLLVGVGEYKDSRHNLPGVKDDVSLVRKVLTEKCGFADPEIRVLLDSEATKLNIVKNFEEWLIRGTGPGDLAIFYFSGHGIRVWDETGRKIQDGQEEAIMPHDANVLKEKTRRTFKQRAGLAYDVKDTVNIIRGEEIRDLLTLLKDRTVVFISDSCHSGTVYKALNGRVAFTKNFELPTFAKGIVDDRRSEPSDTSTKRQEISFGSDVAVQGGKVAAFTACENSQTAEVVPFDTAPTGPHSVFTWHLYHALSGKADRDNSGKITFKQLAAYLQDEIQRGGFSQIPQHEFQPEDLGAAVFETKAGPASVRIDRLSAVKCFLEPVGGISASEIQETQTFIRTHLTEILWVKERAEASVSVVLEKKGKLYLAQISDPSGAVWEPQQGNSLNEAVAGLLGNLKAYFIQANLLALQNYRARSEFNFTYHVKSPAPRAPGEVVNGDAIVMQVTPGSPGYLYIFSVDTVGIIHPLYPMPKSKPQELQLGRAIDLGTDGSFTVAEPCGREVIFAFLLKVAPESLAPFWDKNDIGNPRDPGIAHQRQFLDAMWKELVTSSEMPKGDWTSGVIVLRSFGR